VIPISTLYASPENKSSDLFWAFHPNRAIVPSLPFLLTRPEIPNSLFVDACATRFAAIAESGISSIRPAPKVGVGIRKMTLRFRKLLLESRLPEHAAWGVCPSGDGE